MTKSENKKKLFALALRLQKKFGMKATEGIMARLTKGDKEAIYLLRRHNYNVPRKSVTHPEDVFGREDMIRERERKMTRRGRKNR